MTESLRRKTVSGMLWSAADRFSLQGVQFVINIIMARLLLPADYGIIGMLTVFLQVSQVFIDSGFSSALIQRKDRTEEDFSTVFYFNIVIAFLVYILIFAFAPLIAEFYHMSGLNEVTRIISLTLIINSLSAIYRTKLVINVDFKTQSKVSLLAVIISGTVGIGMAYASFGVWALVYQSLLYALLSTLFFYYFLRWKPLKRFSMASFRKLFSFGSKLLLSSLLHTVYKNLYTIVIGKRFSAIDLGYYTRAEQFATFPSSNFNGIISRVIFPVLSSIQDDDERLTNIYRAYIRLSSYVIFPLMVGLAALAKPVIILLLTDKWSGIVVLLQILCFDWMFDHLSAINLNLLWVKGRSDLSLRLEIVKKTIATLILLISIPFGLFGMCWGRVLYSLIATYLNTYYTKSLIGLSFWSQLKDIFPSLMLALAAGGVVSACVSLVETSIIQLLIGCFVGLLFYLFFSFLFKINSFFEIIALVSKQKTT